MKEFFSIILYLLLGKVVFFISWGILDELGILKYYTLNLDQTFVLVISSIIVLCLVPITIDIVKYVSRNKQPKQTIAIQKKFNCSIGKIIFYHSRTPQKSTITTLIMIWITIACGFIFEIQNITVDIICIFYLLGLALCCIDITVARYRIASGTYGSNAFEARELAVFIVKNSNKIDFTDGNKPKRIINPEDLCDLMDIFAKYPAISDLYPDNTVKAPSKA